MDPELVKEFAAEYHRELNRLNAARETDQLSKKAELERVERQLRAVIDAIKDGLRTASMKDELLTLEAHKAKLQVEIEHAPPPAPRLHPGIADIYRQKVERLHHELNRPELRAQAADVLRSLIEEVRLVPENGRLEIELAGDLAGILALSAGNKKPVTAGRDGLQVTLVAGIGFEPMTFRL